MLHKRRYSLASVSEANDAGNQTASARSGNYFHPFRCPQLVELVACIRAAGAVEVSNRFQQWFL